MKERPIRKRTSPVPKTAINETNASVYCFRGRIILKDLYLKLELIYDHEQEGDFQMPDVSFLALVPHFVTDGLAAAGELLTFTNEGILLKGVEDVYSHKSREKLAMFYLILNYECNKPIQMNTLIRDELYSIQTMLQLVDWVNNFKSEKDIRRILEKNASASAITPTPLPLIPNEKHLTATEIATMLGVSPKTISRNPDQFPSILMGKRKFYLYSECYKRNKQK